MPESHVLPVSACPRGQKPQYLLPGYATCQIAGVAVFAGAASSCVRNVDSCFAVRTRLLTEHIPKADRT